MGETVRLGQVAGVTVGVNWTVGVIFSLIVIVLATGHFPALFPELPGGVHAAAGVSAAVLFFTSLLAHELAHAIVARRHGVGVEGITLWLLGGVARLEGDPPDPGADLRISGVGPLVSLTLAAVFSALTAVLLVADAAGIAVAVAAWLAVINLLLAAFNLVPASPLDGGRVLRALVWRRTGDLRHATEVASRAGQLFGALLVGLGLLAFVFMPGIGGLWVALIGGFITIAAGAEGQQARARGALEGVRVDDLMTPMPLTVRGDLSVEGFLDQYVLRTAHSAFPIVDERGRPTGLVTLNRVRRVEPDGRADTSVAAVACPIEEVPVASPTDPADELLPRMAGCADGRALVVKGGRLVGMVSSRDVMRRLEIAELDEELPPPNGSAARRRPAESTRR